MINPQILALAIFALTYVFIILFYNKKTAIVWISVFLILLLRVLNPGQAFDSIDWNVILLYFGMLFVSEVFLFSKMPDYLASIFASKAKSTAMAMVIICAFTGLLSIFLENVAVVLLVAPIALSIAKKCQINPVPLFIGMAVSSNLQGAATLIGDPPSMLLAGFAKMTFNDFFFINGKPGIFFAVELASLASLFILYFLFKKYKKPMPGITREKFISFIPTFFVIALIASLVIGSSLKNNISYLTGLLCVVFGVIAFIWYLFYTKAKDTKKFIGRLDWQTGIFLIGIFILVQSLSANGILNYVAKFILQIGGGNPFFIFMMIVWISVAISAFVDNIPYLVAMLPVVQVITQSLGASPYLFFFGLLIGASIGGNITPIGASANIVAMGIMKKEGRKIKFWEFIKIGLPFTIVSTAVASMFLWFVLG